MAKQNTIGEKLLALRKKAGLSQEEAADRLGVARQTVSKWETEQSVPELQKTKELCALYGVGYDYLIGPQSPEAFLENPISIEAVAEEIDWTAAWSKKYPILKAYTGIQGIEAYQTEIRALYRRFFAEYGMGHQDTVLVLKDILYGVYKDEKK